MDEHGSLLYAVFYSLKEDAKSFARKKLQKGVFMKRKKVSVAALSLLMLFSFPVLSWAKPQNTEGKWYNHAGKWYFGKDEKSC